jgi:16S rRNA (cytosine967-C5)-methyltransferase
VIRWKGHFDWLLSHFIKRTVKPELRYLLWISLYQIFFMKKAAYHVVKEAVEYEKINEGKYRADFVNAILRRSIRESERIAYPEDETERLSVEYSFPQWLVKRWMARFDTDTARKLLSALNTPPRFGLRISTKRLSRDEAAERLHQKGVTTGPGHFLDSVLYVDRLAPLLKDPFFRSGLIHVQDEASQIAGLSLDARPGDLILDACAGLGTKTAQLREAFPEARVIAADIDSEKLLRMDGSQIDRVRADAVRCPFREGTFDRILLDAPCSSLGIIRKHPEIKWRRREGDIARFSKTQELMLRSLWPLVKKEGTLVYSVCSVEPEETTGVIARFAQEASFVLEKPLPFLLNRDYFLSLPYETDMDGFFVARLRKL